MRYFRSLLPDPEGVTRAGFTSQAYIGWIGGRHGFRFPPHGWGLALAVNAAFLEHGRNWDNRNTCRLWAHGELLGRLDPFSSTWIEGPRLRLQLQGGWERVVQGSIGCDPPDVDPVAEPIVREHLPVVEFAGDFGWRFTVFGQPHDWMESMFLFGGRRECGRIWHSLEVKLKRSPRGGWQFGVDFERVSAFPTHKLWIHSHRPQPEALTTVEQLDLVNLWECELEAAGLPLHCIKARQNL